MLYEVITPAAREEEALRAEIERKIIDCLEIDRTFTLAREELARIEATRGRRNNFV